MIVGIVFNVLIAIIITMTAIHWRDLYQNYAFRTKVDINKIRQLLLIVVRILNRNNINYFVAEGSLLGIYRSGDLIPWDTDGDIIIIDPNRVKVLKIIKDELPNHTILSEGCCVTRCIETFKNNWVDLYFYRETPHQTIEPSQYIYRLSNRYLSWISNYFKMSSHKLSDIYPLQHWKWHGELISLPNNIENILIDQYGPNWNIPKKRKEWENVFICQE